MSKDTLTVIVGGLPVSAKEMKKLLFQKLLETENAKRVLSPGDK